MADKAPKFVKISALSGEDKSKLKTYWAELWGSEYASAIVEDYKPEGQTIQVKANNKK